MVAAVIHFEAESSSSKVPLFIHYGLFRQKAKSLKVRALHSRKQTGRSGRSRGKSQVNPLRLPHMMGSITRLAQDRFRVMVFRSMAKTLVHDFTLAMEAVGARG